MWDVMWEIQIYNPINAIRINKISEYIGAPGEIRTPDRLVRSQVLYPTELRARWRRIIHALAGRSALALSAPTLVPVVSRHQRQHRDRDHGEGQTAPEARKSGRDAVREAEYEGREQHDPDEARDDGYER